MTAKRTPARPWTIDDQSRAEAMLDDGASFREVGRTLGRNRSVIMRRFPGRGYTREQHIEAIRLSWTERRMRVMA